MNKSYILFAILFSGAVYFFIERHPHIELVNKIDCPEDFDYTSFQSINIASNEEQLNWWLSDFFQKPSSTNPSLDSLNIQYAVNSFNFEKYDCVISYHHELVDVYWSPFLTRKLDDCYTWMEQIPLFAQFDNTTTSQIYLYRIKDKYKFRGRCP